MGRKKVKDEKELEKAIVRLHKQHKTYKQIQDLLGCSPTTISKYIKRKK